MKTVIATAITIITVTKNVSYVVRGEAPIGASLSFFYVFQDINPFMI